MDGVLPKQRQLRASRPSVLAVIGLGYLLVLISTLAFLAILSVNSTSSASPSMKTLQYDSSNVQVPQVPLRWI